MRKLITIFTLMILAGSSQAFSQSQMKSTRKPNVEAGNEKSESTINESREKPNAESATPSNGEIKTVEGRPVFIDNQGVQSLEVVSPSQISQPKVEKSVK